MIVCLAFCRAFSSRSRLNRPSSIHGFCGSFPAVLAPEVAMGPFPGTGAPYAAARRRTRDRRTMVSACSIAPRGLLKAEGTDRRQTFRTAREASGPSGGRDRCTDGSVDSKRSHL